MIEAAESQLRSLGFVDVRVRHHELPGAPVPSMSATNPQLNDLTAPPTKPALARIEVGATELPRLLEATNAARIAEELKRIGYAHVTLDLLGYRRGGANDLAPQPVG
jgi:uncharacterized protein